MKFLDIKDQDFDRQFAAILARGEESGRDVEQVVLGIIAAVRERGGYARLGLARGWVRLWKPDFLDLSLGEHDERKSPLLRHGKVSVPGELRGQIGEDKAPFGPLDRGDRVIELLDRWVVGHGARAR